MRGGREAEHAFPGESAEEERGDHAALAVRRNHDEIGIGEGTAVRGQQQQGEVPVQGKCRRRMVSETASFSVVSGPIKVALREFFAVCENVKVDLLYSESVGKYRGVRLG